ncbi:hypothetical protein APE_1483.1 [Aeropyrum pernix K1]|uniref:D-aminoacyl-tRNA deacylase n=1 Tax=Aeropyrum pernix (strain ATCC 700893 / DSM 11879 / JCM 9820 / NBRC 100138 / K1) TaxID=272557 RepID=DTDA_AERPE|nr:D-aminoacyl-tRNA deacylase [Aeropyrum pernix]Q9YBW7.2 RecName: Full=D-aminoacyl-tRNA deacylase; AltName: Full=D-tyrosyl-tRNA(Tyr) deacylase [Aeropyrum pernix K1]BAA80481.2 hypothetical protein APE_1483.1 [Aeropyrum pernix K1]
MRLAVAYSTGDPAGRGAGRALARLLSAEPTSCPGAVECFKAGYLTIAGFPVEAVRLEMLDEAPDPQASAVIVLSKHRAESGRKSLTVHHPGNPTEDNSLGGRPMELAVAYPALAKALLISLAKASRETGLAESYEVTLEATHHGPTTPSKPVVFAELGSTEEDWRNPLGWETLALAVEEAIKTLPQIERECIPAAGFGGTHYVPKHTRLQLESGYCIGHTIPRYAFDRGVTAEVLKNAILKSYPGPARVALVEKKSLKSPQRRMVEEASEEAGAKVEYI